MKNTNVEMLHNIIRQASLLCRTRKTSDITIDMVCQKADIGKGTFYKFFADKEELMKCVVSEQQKKCWQSLNDYLFSIRSLDLKTRLEKSVDYLMNYVNSDPGFRKIIGNHSFLPCTWEEFRMTEDEHAKALLADINALAETKKILPRELFSVILGIHNTAVTMATQAADAPGGNIRATAVTKKYLKDFIAAQF